VCPTRFFGRRRELSVIDALLAGEARLVTLVGPGGAGKTRLAIEVARRIERDERAGRRRVCFCDLTAARDASDLVAALCAAMGVCLDRPAPHQDSAVQLGRALAARGSMVLVLDNFEQLDADAARAVARFMEAAPELRMLVTSREPLRIGGETCCDVGAMAPGDAIDLFEARAKQGDALLLFSDDDRSAIAELSRRLDGLPLAIELAAAKVRVMTPRQLVTGLSSRFDVLRSQQRDVDPRHATLECSIAWSWELLEERERAALAECSVFDGGFDLAAARGVLAAGESALELVESLARKSLLRIESAGDGSSRRYFLYESVREYAARELSRGDSPEAAQARHAHWYVATAESALAAVPNRLGEIANEVDNLVAVVRRCRARDPELTTRAVLALDPLLSLRGPFDFHRNLLDVAVEAAARCGQSALRGRALCARGTARMSGGDLSGAREDLKAARSLSRRDRALEARVVRVQARVAHIAGNHREAAVLYRRAVRAASLAGDRRLEALSIGDRGDLHRRPELLGRALALIAATGDGLAEAQVRWTLGRLERDLDHHPEAVAHLQGALHACREHGARRLEGLTVGSLASALHFAARPEEARRAYRESIDLHAAMGNTMMRAWMLVQLGALEHESGRLAEARGYFDQALRFGREARSARAEGLALAHLGALAASSDRLDEARQLCAAATRRIDVADVAGRDAAALLVASIDVAEARAMSAAGDAAGGEARLERAASALPDARRRAVGLDLIVHIAARVVEAALERHRAPSTPQPAAARGGDQLEIGPDARWFRVATGETVEVAKREPLRRILVHLLVRREGAPSRAVAASELVAAGWPGERMAEGAASNRLRNAIATLRRMGLKGALLTRSDGYMIDPDRPVYRRC
jgi:predicted ATPase